MTTSIGHSILLGVTETSCKHDAFMHTVSLANGDRSLIGNANRGGGGILFILTSIIVV